MAKLNLQPGEAHKSKGYKIIMWDVLSADFDLTITQKTV
jgi:hypothetical protein